MVEKMIAIMLEKISVFIFVIEQLKMNPKYGFVFYYERKVLIKTRTTMKNHKLELTREFIQKLPKAELHCHLDGSLRVSSIIEIAAAEGVTLPTTDPVELKNILAVGLECPSLEV